MEIRSINRVAALYGLDFSFTVICIDGIAMPDGNTDCLLNSIDLNADNDGILDLVKAIPIHIGNGFFYF